MDLFASSSSLEEATQLAAPLRAQAQTKRQLLLNALAVLIMLGGIAAVYGLGLASIFRTPIPPTTANPTDLSAYSYVTDLDFWQKTERARTVKALAPFDLNHDLNNIPLQVGDWKGETKPESNQEVIILLDPEQYVQRLYTNSKGQHLWLSLIGGRSSRPFHPPDICYDADGWQYNMKSVSFDLNAGGKIYGYSLDAQKQVEGQAQPLQHLVSYFYLFPNDQRNLTDGIVLFKLTTGHYGSTEETLAVQSDFVRQLFISTDQPGEASRLGSCTLPLPDTADQTAISMVIRQEGELVVKQEIDNLMGLWAEQSFVSDAKNTPQDEADDQFWRGKDTIRHRYVRTVFPGNPTSVTPADFDIQIEGDRAVITATTHIGNEIAKAGDRWSVVKQNGCWLLESLTYNLEPN